MDSSKYLWFDGIKTLLHLDTDYCAWKIVYGWFGSPKILKIIAEYTYLLELKATL